MDLTKKSQENLEFILSDLTKKLDVANQFLLDPRYYDIEKYDYLKSLYDMIIKKGKLSLLETQAFIDELRSIRK